MKLFWVFVFVIVLTAADESLESKFAVESASYTGALYKEVLKTHLNNFLVCPVSIQIVFALMNSGAKGNTAKQITTALHLPEGEGNIQKLFTGLSKSLQVHDQYTLSSANKIYLANYFKINNKYKSIAVNVFQSDIQTLDFSKTTDAISVINNWVEEKTHKKIKNLVSEDVIDSGTIAVLINALYFQGTWITEFEEVFQGTFKLNNNDVVTTNMMKVYQDVDYFYSHSLQAEFIELPYKGEEVSLTIVLPREVEGLRALEQRLLEVFDAPDYFPLAVNITIPKFKIETTTHLIPILQNMGIIDAFSSAADFSGIGENGNGLVITEVIQKAFIEVDEKGTTAAAATAISTDRIVSSGDYFIADHPFLFYLKHKVNGILFVGRYVKPTEVL